MQKLGPIPLQNYREFSPTPAPDPQVAPHPLHLPFPSTSCEQSQSCLTTPMRHLAEPGKYHPHRNRPFQCPKTQDWSYATFAAAMRQMCLRRIRCEDRSLPHRSGLHEDRCRLYPQSRKKTTCVVADQSGHGFE
jgi:hypothetical protein